MRKLIRTNGTEDEFSEPVSLEAIRKLINAHTLDTVNLRHMGDPLHVMIVDDNGYEAHQIDHGGGNFERVPTKALKPVNEKATALYHANCHPGTTHQIVGDVFVCSDEDFE